MKNSIEIRDLSLNFGAVKVLTDLNLDIHDGEFLVLLGASGCGKSTLLNCIAGLLDVSGGQIFINGDNVTWKEPKERGIGMVFQSYALYPQMTVEGNLSFGLKNAKVPKSEIAKKIAHAASILQIEPLLQRKPGELSGGQRQRVAIGRALVREVEVFLFDEPLSNLDAKLRADLRVEIKRLHQKLQNTMIYVTHDQIEAMTLADRIAIMKDGLVQQLADPRTIYNNPVNKYVAGFIGSPGMNFLDGQLKQGKPASFQMAKSSIDLSNYRFQQTFTDGCKATFGIRPEHIVVGGAAADMPFSQEIEVEIIEPMGSDTLVWAKIESQDFRFMLDGQVQINTGDKVRIGFDPTIASIFDEETELRV